MNPGRKVPPYYFKFCKQVYIECLHIYVVAKGKVQSSQDPPDGYSMCKTYSNINIQCYDTPKEGDVKNLDLPPRGMLNRKRSLSDA